MERKSASGIMVTLMLIGMLPLALNIQPVEAEPGTWTVDDDGPANFDTIQEAINAASPGDTIFVYNGAYYENVVVNKNDLMLVGENRENTIIDGGGKGTVVEVAANDVVVSGFTVQNSMRAPGTSYAGIKISGSSTCNITGNHVTRNKIGIFVTSQRSVIAENLVTNNGQGIAVYSTSEVTVEANNLTGNTVGISLALSFNNMIVGNRAMNSSPGGHGITLSSNSFNNTILRNDLMYNYHGIWLSGSSNNLVVENTIANNELLGIELASSPNNTFYHNNLVNNPTPVRIDNKSISIWDDGYPSGGNYWSNYKERYPDVSDEFQGENQTQPGSDGIWDNPYVINENNQDKYPLVKPYGKIPDYAPPKTVDDYDGLWHNRDFTITLTASDDLSGVAETYFKINNEPIKRVSIDGHPLVQTEGANNTIEYWSIDHAQKEEEHHILTDIKLDKTKPTANAGQDKTVDVEASVTFDASKSTDDLSGIVSYKWNFGDGTTETGEIATHTYTQPGVYTVTLAVKDAADNSDEDSIVVTVVENLSDGENQTSPESFPSWINWIGAAIIGIAIVIMLVGRHRKYRRSRRVRRKSK